MKTVKQSSFPSSLKKLRLECGLTQTALASLAGISHYSISRFENGCQEPNKEHRALLVDVFGLPGYHLFDEDYIPDGYTPAVTINAQERIRLAMLMDDFEYVEEIVHKIHVSSSPEHKNITMIQIKNYLKAWCFFKQGADPDQMLDAMISCMRLSRADFELDSLTRDTVPKMPYSYIEIQILNSIGVILTRQGKCDKASHIFGMLIHEADNPLLEYERRHYRKVILHLNLAMTLRKLGNTSQAEQLLELYVEDSAKKCTTPTCLMLLIGRYLCMDRRSDVFKEKRYFANMFLHVLRHEFGYKKRLSRLEEEIEDGIMVL